MSAEIRILDGVLDRQSHIGIFEMLTMETGWQYGKVSDNTKPASQYWSKHFSGPRFDAREPGDAETQLQENNVSLYNLWKTLQANLVSGHTLTRCYANGYPYGTEGSIHTDANEPGHFTILYYPHPQWNPDWGGETLFFNETHDEITAAVYPRPNRLVLFPAQIPHVGRGVSRICPLMRVTLMFKTKGPAK